LVAAFSGARMLAETFQPCSRKYCAAARPMPLDAPVMRTVFGIKGAAPGLALRGIQLRIAQPVNWLAKELGMARWKNRSGRCDDYCRAVFNSGPMRSARGWAGSSPTYSWITLPSLPIKT